MSLIHYGPACKGLRGHNVATVLLATISCKTPVSFEGEVDSKQHFNPLEKQRKKHTHTKTQPKLAARR